MNTQAHDYWRKRWKEGRIGFHHGAPNPHLVNHLSRVQFDPASERVLIPLCGKSLDLHFLASMGHEVVGVELVEQALIDLFEEAGQPFERVAVGPHSALSGGGVTGIAADIFAVQAREMGAVDWIFDRAALIAIPPEDRARYAEHLSSLLKPGGRLLLTTIRYAQGVFNGPPNSCEDEELPTLFAGRNIERLSQADIIEEMPRFKARGLDYLIETVWLIT